MESGAVTLFLDEYNPDLALERGVFVMGGVVVRSGVHRDRAATAFESLAADDPRFTGKARKWEAAQFDTFATYLLEHEVLPVARWVALDASLLAGLRRRSEDARAGAASPAMRIRPMQWVLGNVLVQTFACASVAWILRHGRISRFDVVIDHGNYKPWQQESLAEVFSQWNGTRAARVMTAMLAKSRGPLDPSLADVRARATWAPPEMRFAKRDPMLAVADGYTSLVAGALGGDACAKAAIERLDASYRYRHAGIDAPFLSVDGTDHVRSDLAQGYPRR